MKRYKQFDNLVVDDFEVEQWKHPLHNHNHFELIFIAEGKGYHNLNDMKSPFAKGDLFLLGPEDEHQFEIKTKCRFIYFKFTRQYITHNQNGPLPEHLTHDADHLLHSPERKKGNLLILEEDRHLVSLVMKTISSEYFGNRPLSQKIIFQLFSTLILVVKRNSMVFSDQEQSFAFSGKGEEIMEYVHEHIYDIQKLTLKNLADQFNYSSKYIGIFFKEKIGTTLRNYISTYRLKLIEERLRHSHIGMKQIAAEFGFVDESHLNKFFKKNNGVSPSFFREKNQRK